MPNDTMLRPGLLVSQDAPAYLELGRLGYGWSTMITTAVAPEIGFPATLADLELWNNTNSGMSMVIDRLSVWEKLGAITAPRSTALFAQVTAPKAVPTLAALVIGSLSGRAPYTAAVGSRVVPAVNTTVIANAWTPWGNPQTWTVPAATPGVAYDAQVNGRLIVPPGCSLCVTIISEAATGTYQVGASWYEIPTLANVL